MILIPIYYSMSINIEKEVNCLDNVIVDEVILVINGVPVIDSVFSKTSHAFPMIYSKHNHSQRQYQQTGLHFCLSLTKLSII